MGDLIRSQEKMNRTCNKSTHFFKAENENETNVCSVLKDTQTGGLDTTDRKFANSIQDLYDATNIKNGSCIDDIASLLSNLKNIKIISDSIFKDNCKNFSEHLNLLGLHTIYYSFEDNFDLDPEDAVLIVTKHTENEKYKCILDNKKNYRGNIISVLSEKDKKKKIKSDFVVYFLDSIYFDTAICVDVILNCIGISILVKLGGN